MLKRMKGFLSIASNVILLVLSACSFGIVVGKNKDEIINKYKRYYKLMCKWAAIDKDSIANYLSGESICSIAVYGCADMGRLLCDQLSDTRIDTRYFIGFNPGAGYKGLSQYGIEDELPDVDAIIITPFVEFDEVKDRLCKKTKSRLMSIEEVINSAQK